MLQKYKDHKWVIIVKVVQNVRVSIETTITSILLIKGLLIKGIVNSDEKIAKYNRMSC